MEPRLYRIAAWSLWSTSAPLGSQGFTGRTPEAEQTTAHQRPPMSSTSRVTYISSTSRVTYDRMFATSQYAADSGERVGRQVFHP